MAVAVSGVLGPVAYARMFAGFSAYDDEGFFLVALRDYLGGTPLMTPTSLPLYGPFYFEVYGGLFRLLGIAPDHDAGRWLTIAVWLTASALGAIVAYRLTRSYWLALAGQLLTFGGLLSLALEPASTYALTALLLIGLSAFATIRSHHAARAALIGGCVGALLLVKINVGVFAGLAVLLVWAAGLEPQGRRFALPAALCLVVVVPFLVTSALIHTAWVIELAVTLGLSLAAVAVVTTNSPLPGMPPPATVWLVAGGAVVVVATLGIALLGGSRPSDMIPFFFVVPLRFPGVFVTPMDISPAVSVWAAVMLAAALLVRFRGTRLPAAARISAGVFIWLTVLLSPSTVFLVALPVLWVACMPPPGEDPVGPYSRLLLTSLAILEMLQAYPVAGTQTPLAAVGLIPVGAMILADGIRQAGRSSGWIAAAPTTAVALATALVSWVVIMNFSDATTLGLPGAEMVRVQPAQGAALRSLVGAIAANHCSDLVTYPGMDSLYLWTSRGSSVETRYTVWYVTTAPSEQRRIVRQWSQEENLCVVKNQRLIDFWAKGRVPNGPFVDFVNGGFVEAGQYGDYELLVRSSS
jgi:hypothetical protein